MMQGNGQVDEKNKLMWAINPSKTADFPNPQEMKKWSEAKQWVDYVNKEKWWGITIGDCLQLMS